MKKSVLRCRCGHHIAAREVLRTDLYERRASEGAGEYVCVRYRCRNCRRLSEVFVAESRWDWGVLDTDNSELSDAERERFGEQEPISEAEVSAFHSDLENILHVDQLDPKGAASTRHTSKGETASSETAKNSLSIASDAASLDAASLDAASSGHAEQTPAPDAACESDCLRNLNQKTGDEPRHDDSA